MAHLALFYARLLGNVFQGIGFLKKGARAQKLKPLFHPPSLPHAYRCYQIV